MIGKANEHGFVGGAGHLEIEGSVQMFDAHGLRHRSDMSIEAERMVPSFQAIIGAGAFFVVCIGPPTLLVWITRSIGNAIDPMTGNV